MTPPPRAACSLALTLLAAIAALLPAELPARAADSVDLAAGPSAVSAMHAKGVAAGAALVDALDRQKSAAGEGAASPELAARIDQLRALEANYFQHETLLAEESKLSALTRHEEKELARLKEYGPAEPKPYSFRLLEKLRSQCDDEQDRQASIKAETKAARQLLATHHDELDSANERQRQAKQDKSTNAQVPLAEQSSANLAVSVAAARVDLAETVVEIQSLRLGASQARQKQLEEEIDQVKKGVHFTADDRDRELERLSDLESDLDQQRAQEAARWREAAVANGDPSAPGSTPRTDDAVTARDVSSALLLLVDQEREVLGSLRKLWKRRYELAHGDASGSQTSQWLDDVDECSTEIKDWRQTWEQRLATLARTKVGTKAAGDRAAGDRAAGDKANSDAGWEEFRAGAMERLWQAFHAAEHELREDQRWLARFRDELKTQLKEQGRPALVPRWLAGIWDYEILSDKQNPITLGKLLVLIFYVLAGLLLAWLASWVVGFRLLRRWGWHPGRIAALKSILFYTLCVLFGFVAFKALQIPLGAFAFLGGAAAIAVGFGSQDIMNNFMSGIILLVEQPIRVGDVIELDDVQGRVVYIGLRSTRMLTEANHETIVPNKTLLDEQVTNLTLSDQFVRRVITIDVDRTRPVAATKRRMQELAFFHPLVIKSPPPMVLLTEVDSYALRFEIHIWMEHHSFLKCASIQSEVLESITAEFPPLDETSGVPESASNAPAEGSVEPERNGSAPGDAAAGHESEATGPAANGLAADPDAGATQASPPPAPDIESNRQLLNRLGKLGRAAVKRELKRSGLK